ncbi:MAG: helix-turn-helix transcriptional regulator [Okeania sp. SIO2C9]|uniref:AraC family transcriptional regulator n=1 Tax=Okeania sp. SIO2C9 TaxID=2607791 RepID=UPI0013BEFB17|nr:AraC family transcriptional regulator [Okeania sp. SIO2C9]NEQ75125.1 helix-turn-helix transcriptional regulator [Okeania sp. SIO2C9]
MILQSNVIPQSTKISDQPESSKLLISSKQNNWQGILLQRIYYSAAESKFSLPAIPEELLIIHLDYPCHIERSLKGKYDRGRIVPGDITVVPSGEISQWHIQGNPDLLYIYLAPSLMEKVATEVVEVDPQRIELVDRFTLRDPFIRQVGLLLLGELESGGVAGRLYAESLAYSLTVHLVREYSTMTLEVNEYRGGLSKYRLRQAIEYINEHLDRDLKLARIAAVVGMSQYHFSRLFKQSMGISPYKYVIHQRVEMAKKLLKQQNISITEIAFQCGFSHQSHLTKIFHQLTGTTPKQYKNQVI